LKLKEALAQARVVLADNDVEAASLEAEVLLRHVLGISRTQLYLDLDRNISPAYDDIWHRQLKRRRRGEPLAYITGHREFYGLDFQVDGHVLIPRPESELLVEKALSLARQRDIATIAEIGTGCGAIAVSLAVSLPGVKIYATDVSGPALEVARANCRAHGVSDRICLLRGDMLDPLPGPVDLIIANLPYVREAELTPSGPLSFEPALALNGGPDGLSAIRSLCCQVGNRLSPHGCLLLEVGQGQADMVVSLLRGAFPSARIEAATDFNGIERVVSACLTRECL
jgi:release factor glutamine methyltransferase